MGRSGASLAPGFRFHPTDEELVWYYLKRKVTGKPLRYDPISEVDVYKCEPWDLPDKSRLRTRDLEWYFFSVLDKKYGNGSKTNRATENGYWKTTGKDRPIHHGTRVVGMKKTLVYHSGRAPRGQRSNWVMHEYKIIDDELEKAGIAQDAFVLCRIFQKSGPGPKNGEQYGAPFIDEEWEDDAVALFPEQQALVNEVVSEEDANLKTEVDQTVTVAIIPGRDALPMNCHDSTSNDNQPLEEINGHCQTVPDDTGKSQSEEQQSGENKLFSLPVEYEIDAKHVKREFSMQPTDDINIGDNERGLDSTFMDVGDNSLPGDTLCLYDSYSVECPDDFNVEDYLNFSDTDVDNLIPHDSSELMTIDNPISGEPFQSLEDVCGEIECMPETDMLPSVSQENNEASSSNKNPMEEHHKPDFQHNFIKKASQRWGSFPAPPAFASEYPIKEGALQLNSAAHASSSVHVTAGMIRIRSLTLRSSSVEWSIGKNGELNIVLSFGISQDDVTLFPAPGNTPGLLSNKRPPILSWFRFFLVVLWILALSATPKIGASIYSR
ncbi:hypothetical protein SAY87_019299 [Trapa incisa]|uniref:NAC domain-containing protein n=1 Tax=Trapa incisa TaxID=236973 RepID=A0AAN7Q2B1_9MYRT|nr:hypothetical protein SAY87_019299 [Trapa incisa]